MRPQRVDILQLQQHNSNHVSNNICQTKEKILKKKLLSVINAKKQNMSAINHINCYNHLSFLPEMNFYIHPLHHATTYFYKSKYRSFCDVIQLSQMTQNDSFLEGTNGTQVAYLREENIY